MPTRVSDRLTIITPDRFLAVLAHAWVNLFDNPPSKEQLLVLMAQSALETGRWKYVHNYNFGNVKAVAGQDGRDYAYYPCNEILDSGAAAAYVAKSTAERPAKIASQRQDGKAEIWFYPEHPGCCFRAYLVQDDQGVIDEDASMLVGMTDYLGLLSTRFKSAWPAVLAGNPADFVQRLKSMGYFTADLAPYLASVQSLFREYSKMPFNFELVPLMSDQARQAVMDIVTLTYDEYVIDT